MKKKYIQSKIAGQLKKLFFLLVAGMVILPACKRSYLDPDPLSLYEPGKTFSTKSGLDAAMAICDRHLRSYWTYFQ